jgi:hypothetical protein
MMTGPITRNLKKRGQQTVMRPILQTIKSSEPRQAVRIFAWAQLAQKLRPYNII